MKSFLFLLYTIANIAFFPMPSTCEENTTPKGASFYVEQDPSIAHHFLLSTHRLKPILDRLFSSPKVFNNAQSFEKEGFKILHKKPCGMLVVSHPSLPRYLLKLHLKNSQRQPDEAWRNFIRRCQGAENIRVLIKEKNLRYFTVPNKKIYVSPIHPEIPVLVVTDMNIFPSRKSKEAWQTLVTKKHLQELYCILSHGYASSLLPANIPYTKDGTFACVDTECPQRIPRYENAKAHLSNEMKGYWDELVRTGGRI